MPERKLLYLDVAAVLAIHEEVLSAHGGRPGLRDRFLLESAVAAPQATAGGHPLIRDPVDIGAAYLFYICRNHPFVDGNKRTALASALVFLQINGFLPNPDAPASRADAWEALIIDVASSRLDRDALTRRIKKLLQKAGPR